MDSRIQDLTARAMEDNIANATLIKLHQIGTVT
ncbi:enolase, partial [Acidithiobacillus ferrooxidans]|nr:enolase [Acidithiobacillus ferrooxidans]